MSEQWIIFILLIISLAILVALFWLFPEAASSISMPWIGGIVVTRIK